MIESFKFVEICFDLYLKLFYWVDCLSLLHLVPFLRFYLVPCLEHIPLSSYFA